MDTRFVRADTVKLPPPDTYDVAIAAVYVRVTDRKGSIGLPDDEAAVVNRLLSAGKPVVVAGFGSPYLAENFSAAKTYIAAFGTGDVAQWAMGRALFGQTAVGGRVPVNIPGVARARRGTRSRRESRWNCARRTRMRKKNYSARMTCSIRPSPITRFPAACWPSATRMN